MRGVGFAPRGALLRPSGPAHNPGLRHLHAICTDEDQFGLLLLVPICSFRNPLLDRTCLLDEPDHERLRWLSFVDYNKAEILELATLQDWLRKGYIVPEPDFLEEVFHRIVRGMLTTRKVRQAKRDYFVSRQTLLPEAA